MSTTRINEFHAATGQARALREFLHGVITVIKESPGCQGCELLVGHDDDARLAIIEKWESTAAHQAAASRIPPAKLSEIQPLLAEPPKGRYYDRI